jgi:hypothetical protein
VDVRDLLAIAGTPRAERRPFSAQATDVPSRVRHQNALQGYNGQAVEFGFHALMTRSDRDAAERSMRMLSFFKEREARDELGIGAVCDAIADGLFSDTKRVIGHEA